MYVFDPPRLPLCCMRNFAAIVTKHSLAKITRATDVEALWVGLALQNINVREPTHLVLACRVVARNIRVVNEKCPPSPRLRRGSLRSPPCCERRLEARGVEPLSSSLSAQTSTRLSGDKF